jgi:hypothetical protein
MARIFYCGGSSGRLGILRAVVPLPELEALLRAEELTYLGQLFPDLAEESSALALAEIFADEETESWAAGFYRFGKNPLQFEEIFRARHGSADRSTG